MKMQGTFVCVLALAIAAGSAGASTSAIPCATVPVDFCTIDVGCEVNAKGVCTEDPTAPPVNCSLLLASSGAAVSTAETALLASLTLVKDTTWITMQNTQAVFVTARTTIKAYDDALYAYNMSLVAYEKEADKLAALNAALAELKLNCSIPTAPVTCPAAILKAQEIIAMQTATCEVKWVATTLGEQTLTVADAAVAAQDAAVKDAMTAPAKIFSDAAASIKTAESKKTAAIGFWTTVKNACIHASLASSAESTSAETQMRVAAAKRLARKKARLHVSY
jgi:hypothetical protein